MLTQTTPENNRFSRPWAQFVIGFLVILVLSFSILNHAYLFDLLTRPGLSPVHASGSLVGGPSLSVTFTDEVLKRANSPAQGVGERLYQLSEQYQIDNAYALAFFHHESSYGTQGVAASTRNWGNIKCTSGYRCSEGFRSYESWEAGLEDWFKLIKEVYLTHGLNTTEKIIPVYAPSSDGNNVTGYVQAVENDVRLWRGGKHG